MLALGIILVLLAAAAILAALFGGTVEPLVFELGAFNVTTNTLTVFVAGALTVLVLVVGLGLIRAGLRRARQRRQEKKELNRLASKLEEREATRSTDARTGPEDTGATTDTKAAPAGEPSSGGAAAPTDSAAGQAPDTPGSHRSTP